MHLKEGDQICEAVLDTFPDQYLNYIKKLVKHSKTPNKNNNIKQKQQHSSSSSTKEISNNKINHIYGSQNNVDDIRNRRHSQSSSRPYEKGKKQQFNNQDICQKIYQQPNSLINSKKVNKKQEFKPEKRQQYKIESSQYKKNKLKNQNIKYFQNQQKTITFSHQKRSQKLNYNKGIQYNHEKSNNMFTQQQQQQKSQQSKISIIQNIKRSQKTKNKQNHSHTFIDSMDDYINFLRANPSIDYNEQFNKNRKSSSKSKRQKTNIIEQQLQIDKMNIILQENIKLRKKVKDYHQKIEECQDQISSHLVQCKNRDRENKHKIAQLVKALTQANNKINSQKKQINTMKNLLKSFGQKVKQIQHQQSDSEEVDELIQESIYNFIKPQRVNSEMRTRYKKGLESTMPKYEQQRRYWKQ